MIEFHYDDGFIVMTWNRSLTINIFIDGVNTDCVTIPSWAGITWVQRYCDGRVDEMRAEMHEVTA